MNPVDLTIGGVIGVFLTLWAQWLTSEVSVFVERKRRQRARRERVADVVRARYSKVD